MPCFCKLFPKNTPYRALDNVNQSSANSTTDPVTSQQVSASELVQLKAEVWSLRNSLSDAISVNNNMQDAITQTVAEKYSLLDELCMAKNEMALLESQQRTERDVYCQEKDKFLQEIASYRIKINELSHLVDKISEQNIELKKSLLEANDTVYKIGRNYMKLKTMEN
ncbi:uncharacterized protein LOC131688904 [Topomyia yanbarensis]|uniref:uncharacterized protein LOC131688904 n=1 Tax=Topomyia yanbarensis TaxID=2498891 RepID=UPI00273CC21F|nr:uncharacterized protein LOC131688904 [Topomyia yanbarensis]